MPARTRFGRLESFVRDYTKGLSSRELARLFDRDAVQAYSVLTREHTAGPEPAGRVRRLLFRARIVFLGLSYKLTPARRLLFAVSLLMAVLGLGSGKLEMTGRHSHVTVEFSAFWFMGSICGLLLLLALELVDRIRVRDELEVARELQAELLPHSLPSLPGYRFAHSYRTANEVGGDYYDITPLPDGRVALMVGDASGHGMAAGLVMAIANATLKTALDIDPAPPQVAALLDRTLCRTGGSRTFMTVFYGLLTPDGGHLEWLCAGHPPPLLRRAGGELIELGTGSFPMGVRGPLAAHVCESVTLAPGDLLVLYTDGLAEAVSPSGLEAFGYERIAALARLGGTPQNVHDRILEAFDRHVKDEPLRDDLTLMVVAREARAG